MAEVDRIYTERHERANALGQLGLTEDVLLSVVSRAVLAKRRCTAFDAPATGGFIQWATGVRSFRELLCPDGWTPDDTGGFSTVVSPDGTIAIAVAGGDEKTGIKLPVGVFPSTKRGKGSCTFHAVRTNQLSLFDTTEARGLASSSDVIVPAAHKGPTTWFLLVFNDDRQSVRAELSCPSQINAGGRMTEFACRIVLDMAPGDSPRPDDDPPDSDIDVPVERI